MRTLLALFLIAAPPCAFGAYASTSAWIPVAGHSVGAGGRLFASTLSVANDSQQLAHVKVSFFPSAKSEKAPRSIELHIPPAAVQVVEIGAGLITATESIGALRITSNVPVIAEARVSSSDALNGGPVVGAVLNAIPAGSAIGTAERTVLHGPAPRSRYALHAVETAGHSLILIATTFDAKGRRLQSRRLYLDAHEQRSWSMEGGFAALRVGAMSGSGKAIVAGTEIVEGSQDIVAHEMTLPSKIRHALPRTELAAYAVVAIAIAFVAFYNRKKAHVP